MLRELISVLVFSAIILVEVLSGATLFEKSQTFIPQIQEDASEFSKSAWNFYSAYVLVAIIFAPTLITYMFIE